MAKGIMIDALMLNRRGEDICVMIKKNGIWIEILRCDGEPTQKHMITPFGMMRAVEATKERIERAKEIENKKCDKRTC